MARNGKTEAKTNLPGKDECEGTVCFHTVLESEHKTINARRNGKRPAVKPRVPKPNKTDHGNKRDPIYDTIGVALSGGGIRSAAFCLGALQALEVAGALKQVDYPPRCRVEVIPAPAGRHLRRMKRMKACPSRAS